MNRFLTTLLTTLIALPSFSLAEPVTETHTYAAGDVTLEGYLARPADAAGDLPGVLVFHQWGGPSEHEFERARALADLGYVALVADVYGVGIRPETMEERAALSGHYKSNRGVFRERVNAALAALREIEGVDDGAIAAIGYCFGGTAVLELARSGADVSGVISFHGGLGTPTPDDAENITCPVLVLHGADDPYVPPEEVAGFKEEMENAGVDYRLIAYPGAVHSFSDKGAGDDPSTGAAYNAEVDAAAWNEAKAFLAEVLTQAE